MIKFRSTLKRIYSHGILTLVGGGGGVRTPAEAQECLALCKEALIELLQVDPSLLVEQAIAASQDSNGAFKSIANGVDEQHRRLLEQLKRRREEAAEGGRGTRPRLSFIGGAGNPSDEAQAGALPMPDAISAAVTANSSDLPVAGPGWVPQEGVAGPGDNVEVGMEEQALGAQAGGPPVLVLREPSQLIPQLSGDPAEREPALRLEEAQATGRGPRMFMPVAPEYPGGTDMAPVADMDELVHVEDDCAEEDGDGSEDPGDVACLGESVLPPSLCVTRATEHRRLEGQALSAGDSSGEGREAVIKQSAVVAAAAASSGGGTASSRAPNVAATGTSSGAGVASSTMSSVAGGGAGPGSNIVARLAEHQRQLAELRRCVVCHGETEDPASLPCGHNFCLTCLEAQFEHSHEARAKARREFKYEVPDRCALCKWVFSDGLLVTFCVNETLAKGYELAQDILTASTQARALRVPLKAVPLAYCGPITPEYIPYLDHPGHLPGTRWDGSTRADLEASRLHRDLKEDVAYVQGQPDLGAQSFIFEPSPRWEEMEMERKLWFVAEQSGSKEQQLSGSDEALIWSCKKGLPVRVLKRERTEDGLGLTYRGIFHVQQCWRATDLEGELVYCFLFVCCDNDVASPDVVQRLQLSDVVPADADVTEAPSTPAWGQITLAGTRESKWGWTAGPPRQNDVLDLRRLFPCALCHDILTAPVSMPCGHNACTSCKDNYLAAYWTAEFEQLLKAQSQGVRITPLRKECFGFKCMADLAQLVETSEENKDLQKVIGILHDLRADFVSTFGEHHTLSTSLARVRPHASSHVHA